MKVKEMVRIHYIHNGPYGFLIAPMIKVYKALNTEMERRKRSPGRSRWIEFDDDVKRLETKKTRNRLKIKVPKCMCLFIRIAYITVHRLAKQDLIP